MQPKLPQDLFWYLSQKNNFQENFKAKVVIQAKTNKQLFFKYIFVNVRLIRKVFS